MKLRPSAEFAKEYFKQSITVVEIGTFLGNNARNMLERMNIKKLYIIDPYERYEGYTNYPDRNFEKVYNVAQKKLKPYEDKIVWIRKHSDNAIDDIPQADYIYVDGDHSYTQTLSDMRNYWLKVKKHGIIGGHDIKLERGVRKAYDQFLIDIGAKKENSKNQSFESRPDWWIIKNDKIVIK